VSRARQWVLAALVVPVSSCAPLTDEVFARVGLAASAPIIVAEGAGVVELTLRLAEPAHGTLSLAYQVVGIEAQQDCQAPDFQAADGRVEWSNGATDAQVRVSIGDDELAERDERFEIRLEDPDKPAEASLGRVEVVIADDDRSALLDARDLGVVPGVTRDQSATLQAALDQAGRSGRAVVTMAPGDYEISSVTLPPGTTLSGYDVRWHRPPLSAVDVVSLRSDQKGTAASAPSLVEGLTIDGRRDAQGEYRGDERDEAHLLGLQGDAVQGGVNRTTFERVHLLSGTGSGLFIGPNADVTVCNLSASELWRDALTLNGGEARLRLRGLDATATQGTGLWLGAHAPGYGNSYRIDVEAEDLQIGAGDVEIETTDSSRVDLRRLIMTQAPFRLDASGGTVHIEDSVLVTGLRSAFHNQWAFVHDVQVTRSTIIASERDDAGVAAEAAREFPAIAVTSRSFALGPPTPGSGRLTFTDCRFELAPDVEADDVVYGIDNPDVDATVVVTSSKLGVGFASWFAPTCTGCSTTM
jgi:hypothetical protein